MLASLFARKPQSMSQQTALVGKAGFDMPLVLIVTADLCFYSSIVNAAARLNWRTELARTARRALEIHESELARIVVCDRDLPDVDWCWLFENLAAAGPRSRLLLASRHVDETLWRRVLACHGYDAIERAATSAELSTTLRFAWASLVRSLGDATGLSMPAPSSRTHRLLTTPRARPHMRPPLTSVKRDEMKP